MGGPDEEFLGVLSLPDFTGPLSPTIDAVAADYR
jgi:hypothetical protein